MSHFTVLVIGDDYAAQLAPFQENNNGDCPEEYLEFQDRSAEVDEAWDTGTCPAWYADIRAWSDIDAAALADLAEGGTAFVETDQGLWDFELSGGSIGKRIVFRTPERDSVYAVVRSLEVLAYRDNGYPSKLRIGVDAVPAPDDVLLSSRYVNKAELAKEWFGYRFDETENAFGYWTNPNSKWDWYQVGGRWQGFFRLKPADQILRTCGHCGRLVSLHEATFNKTAFGFDLEECPTCHHAVPEFPRRGERSLLLPEEPSGAELRADVCVAGDIDFEGMERDARDNANVTYARLEAAVADIADVPRPWSEFLARANAGEISTEQARTEYHAQAWVAAVQADSNLAQWDACSVDYYCVHSGGREEFVRRAANRSCVSFAVVKHGEWFERGSMGWWGVVTDEKDADAWCDQVHELLRHLPSDMPLALVDCHI